MVEGNYKEFIDQVKLNYPDLDYDEWIRKIYLPIRSYPDLDKTKLLPENIDQLIEDQFPLNVFNLERIST